MKYKKVKSLKEKLLDDLNILKDLKQKFLEINNICLKELKVPFERRFKIYPKFKEHYWESLEFREQLEIKFSEISEDNYSCIEQIVKKDLQKKDLATLKAIITLEERLKKLEFSDAFGSLKKSLEKFKLYLEWEKNLKELYLYGFGGLEKDWEDFKFHLELGKTLKKLYLDSFNVYERNFSMLKKIEHFKRLLLKGLKNLK